MSFKNNPWCDFQTWMGMAISTSIHISIIAVVKLTYQGRLKRIQPRAAALGTTTFTALTDDNKQLIVSIPKGDVRLILQQQHVRNVQSLVTGP